MLPLVKREIKISMDGKGRALDNVFILQTQNLGCEPEDVVNPESSL